MTQIIVKSHRVQWRLIVFFNRFRKNSVGRILLVGMVYKKRSCRLMSSCFFWHYGSTNVTVYICFTVPHLQKSHSEGLQARRCFVETDDTTFTRYPLCGYLALKNIYYTIGLTYIASIQILLTISTSSSSFRICAPLVFL